MKSNVRRSNKGFNPKKKQHSVRFSQNYFVNPSLVRFLISKTTLTNKDTVVEIGPGRGIITRELAKKCGKVIAVEKDRKLGEELKASLVKFKNVEVVICDILNFRFPKEDYKVFCNPPFGITTKIIQKLFLNQHPPVDSYIVMQNEAAIRISSQNKEYYFAMQMRPWYSFKIQHRFKGTDFSPVPEVDVVLLSVRSRKKAMIPIEDRQSYLSFLKPALLGGSKSLRKNLSAKVGAKQWGILCKNSGVETDATPLSLELENWVDLFNSYNAYQKSINAE